MGSFDYKQASTPTASMRWRKPFAADEGTKPGIRVATKNQSAVSPQRGLLNINGCGAAASAASSTMMVVVGTGASGVAGSLALSSPDGIVWTSRNIVTSALWSNVVWDGTEFVALAGGGECRHSSDGITWNAGSTSVFSNAHLTVFNGVVYLFPQGVNSTYYASSDHGATWVSKTAPTNAGTVKLGVAVYGGTMYNLRERALYSTTDGTNWTLVNTFDYMGLTILPAFVIANSKAIVVGLNTGNSISTSISKNGGATWSQFANVAFQTIPSDSWGQYTGGTIAGTPAVQIGPATGRSTSTVMLAKAPNNFNGRMVMGGRISDVYNDGSASVTHYYHFVMHSVDGYDWTAELVSTINDAAAAAATMSFCQFGGSMFMPLTSTPVTPTSINPSLNLDFEELIYDYS